MNLEIYCLCKIIDNLSLNELYFNLAESEISRKRGGKRRQPPTSCDNNSAVIIMFQLNLTTSALRLSLFLNRDECYRFINTHLKAVEIGSGRFQSLRALERLEKLEESHLVERRKLVLAEYIKSSPEIDSGTSPYWYEHFLNAGLLRAAGIYSMRNREYFVLRLTTKWTASINQFR